MDQSRLVTFIQWILTTGPQTMTVSLLKDWFPSFIYMLLFFRFDNHSVRYIKTY